MTGIRFGRMQKHKQIWSTVYRYIHNQPFLSIRQTLEDFSEVEGGEENCKWAFSDISRNRSYRQKKKPLSFKTFKFICAFFCLHSPTSVTNTVSSLLLPQRVTFLLPAVHSKPRRATRNHGFVKSASPAAHTRAK